MKRILAALAVLGLLLSLVGCGGKAVDGVFSDFTAADIDGNNVDASIFRDCDLTMVNIWGTFCVPCIQEMPYLAQLSVDYADRGFQIVGIVMDAADSEGNVYPEELAAAHTIVEVTGADYLHLLPSPSLTEAKLADVLAIPETIFVDKNGEQVGDSYLGAKSYDDWAAIIEELLEDVA